MRPDLTTGGIGRFLPRPTHADDSEQASYQAVPGTRERLITDILVFNFGRKVH